MMTKDKINLIGKAKRVSLLRNITGYSRREFCKKTQIAERTLQFWEKGEGNGVTNEGAKALLKACEKLGVYASYEWLMFGFGDSPLQKQGPDCIAEQTPLEAYENIKLELNLFRKQHLNAVDLTIEDDSMSPFFKKGDLVAGEAYYGDAIKNEAIGYDCIVLTKEAKKLFRRVKQGSLEGWYTLASHNLQSNVSNLILQDIELISAAPLLWLRRNQK